ncbi:DNA-binding protein [Sulfurimonas sp.]|uniref:DNA-binding protein n=1 Tax=Sulfurimonas sp. TaxID=2022749 RepID=UPI0025CBE2FB|nr:DNA-binding protein [Sulfurimonas sp.]
MSKMNIADAALKLGVSKEAIHNRIRRGSLESVIEDGVKYVLLKEDGASTNKPSTKRTNTRVMHEADSRYYKLLEEQNERLQQKVDKLEGETKTLREQKEQILIEERIRIENIYKDKDEQLKNILNAISSKFLLNSPSAELVLESEELVEAEIESEEESNDLISLKKYLKDTKYSDKKSQKIKDRVKKVSKKDSRIVTVGKKFYINPAKFDYSDIIH